MFKKGHSPLPFYLRLVYDVFPALVLTDALPPFIWWFTAMDVIHINCYRTSAGTQVILTYRQKEEIGKNERAFFTKTRRQHFSEY